LISNNIRVVTNYLQGKYPDYLFLNFIDNNVGQPYTYDSEGYPWRLFPFIENSVSFNTVASEGMAFAAAKEFGKLTMNLNKLDCNLLSETIPQFHDLSFRYRQFEDALNLADAQRLKVAHQLIECCKDKFHLVEEYNELIANGKLIKRAIHNDCKINNVLFHKVTTEAICIVDLDTLMPGYFIYDLGDMVRTFVSPVSEEEKDYSKIVFRENIYNGLLDGYSYFTKNILSKDEMRSIPFAGKMMTFMIALRFLTDYLLGDKYYQTSYSGQNLVRAGNQLKLLEVITKSLK